MRRKYRYPRRPVGPITSSTSKKQHPWASVGHPQQSQQNLNTDPIDPHSFHSPCGDTMATEMIQGPMGYHSLLSRDEGHLSGIGCNSRKCRHLENPTIRSTSQQQQVSVDHCQQSQQSIPINPVDPHASHPHPSPQYGQSNTVSTRRGKRGPTRCHSVWKTDYGQRIPVSMNEFGQAVGPNAARLISFMGTIARDGHMVPLTYVDWRRVPDELKEAMWNIIKSKFEVDPAIKTWVLKSIATKWRDWKALLKNKHYKVHETDEERLADLDDRVEPDQWQSLVEFWSSEEGKKLSAINSANRKRLKISHTTGTKSFARLREEERVKRVDGEEPSRAEFFILTHTRKDGSAVDQASALIMSQLKERASQQPESLQDNPPGNDILSQVMREGRRGRTSNAEALRIASEAKRAANEEVHKVRGEMEEMKSMMVEMKSQMSVMLSTIQRLSTSEPLSNKRDSEDSRYREGSLLKQLPIQPPGMGSSHHNNKTSTATAIEALMDIHIHPNNQLRRSQRNRGPTRLRN
ncbi:hypothetical protein QJS10_CPB13g00710 [Acorus calamus]|uniref:Transposase n=1 Tax=Acorus calamus TaxID=4465 RepID=A0AAV9DJL6_ACOCL|nr:hypothetical protein QJS10_CPB13g00710 [Acorus calamus]